MGGKDLRFDYATTNRAGCKGCKLKIQKNELRIGQETLFQGEHTTTVWRHLDCFSLGRKYKDIDPKEIEGYYDLKKEDKVRVIDYFEGGGQKKSVVDKLISAITDSEKKKKQDDDSDDKDYDQDAAEQKKQNEQKQQKGKKKTTQTRQKKRKPRYSSSSSSSEEEDLDSDTEDDLGDDSETDNSGSDSDYERQKIILNKKKKEVVKKKVKGKNKGKSELNMGYTPDQLIKFKENLEFFEKKTADYLKSLLGVNNQPKTGTKNELVLKCADGKTLGQIPLCLECGGGKLRFDIQTGIYKCPGYMDDDVFQNCGKKFTLEQIERKPWIDDII